MSADNANNGSADNAIAIAMAEMVHACITRKREALKSQRVLAATAAADARRRLDERAALLGSEPWNFHDMADLAAERSQLERKTAHTLSGENAVTFEEDVANVLQALAGTSSMPHAPAPVNSHVVAAGGGGRRRQTMRGLTITVGKASTSTATSAEADDVGSNKRRRTSRDGSVDACCTEAVADEFLDRHDAAGRTRQTYALPNGACESCSGTLLHDASKDMHVCTTCAMETQAVFGSTHGGSECTSGKTDARRYTYFKTHKEKFQCIYTSPAVTAAVVNEIKAYLDTVMRVRRVHTSAVHTALLRMNAACHDRPNFWKSLLPFKGYITAKITGEEGPKFTPEVDVALDRAFRRYCEAFDTLRAEGRLQRKNMLFYFRLLHNLLEMHEWGAPFLKHFRGDPTCLKGQRQDADHRLICERAELPYVQTN